MADQSLAVTASYSTTAAPATTDTVAAAGRTAPRAARTVPRVIYLAGLGRSGSTLLERLVGELPGACAVGEVVHLWHRSLVHNERCGCGVPFAECDFWRQVGDAGFGGWFSVDPLRVARLRAGVDRNRFVPLLAGPTLPSGLRRTHEEYVGYYRRLYSAVSEVVGCDAVVDSSKHPSLAFCLSKAAGLDVRVIHVVRDSRAVAYSWGERAARPDGGVEAYMRQLRPTSSAAQWTGHNALMHLMDRTDTPMMRVRYEDVVHTPAAVLRDIASFAGLTVEDGSLGFLGEDDAGHWAQLAPAHTVSGHGLRFSTGRIAIRPDERWQTAMPPAHRHVVTAATFPLLARYGYVRLTGHGPAGAASGSPGPD
ncbi:MAG TPA: sulfotransferase [Solirubrobacteraceae bacterium]|nr:sulfotransferase [Solirubrobacteraceae bacterium]